MNELTALSGSLAKLSADELAKILALSDSRSVSDLMDLAKHLLSTRELERRVRLLSATSLASLRGGQLDAESRQWLLGIDQPFEMAVELAQTLQPGPTPAIESEPHGAVLAAFHTLTSVTEIIFAAERRLLSPVRSGLRAPDARALAEVLQLDVPQLQLRVQLAIAAKLLASGTRLTPTTLAYQWLDFDNSQKWQFLASSIWDFPGPLEPGQELLTQLQIAFPLRNLAELEGLRFAEVLGVSQSGKVVQADPSGNQLLPQLPEAVESFVVLPDLSITTLGPISAAMHSMLDSFAVAEDLGLSARFRLSPLSICQGFEHGLKPEQILSFLEQHSKAELPQPVRYLIADVQQKFGTLRVVGLAQGTAIETDDPILARQLLSQHNLRPLLLESRGERIYSRLDSELIYFNLQAHGYLAVMVQAGQVLSPRAHPAPLEETTDLDLTRARELIENTAAQAGVSDIERQLTFAIRNKVKVGLRVSSDQGEREFLIEPLGLSGNRLRGRDSVKQAELTLPLSRVVALWLA